MRLPRRLHRAGSKEQRFSGQTWIFICRLTPEEVSVWAGRLKASLARIRQMPLPARIKTRIPEGYAHYGLFPEVYLAAARKFHEERKPADVVCIGLRSIGASLSSVIAAELESLGSTVPSFNPPPTRPPFTRKGARTA